MIGRMVRSADLCFHIVMYHVTYKCMAKNQDTPLCENNNWHLALFFKMDSMNVKPFRFYKFYKVHVE